MQFAYTIIYVPVVSEALEFYERAFGLERRFLSETGDYGELNTGNTVLAFANETLGKQNGIDVRPLRPHTQAPAIEIAFTTENPAEAIAKALQAGATAVQPATQKPWGQTVGYVRDPNGVLLELCTPMS